MFLKIYTSWNGKIQKAGWGKANEKKERKYKTEANILKKDNK